MFFQFFVFPHPTLSKRLISQTVIQLFGEGVLLRGGLSYETGCVPLRQAIPSLVLNNADKVYIQLNL